MENMIESLAIVIVSMNLRDDTYACIKSLCSAGASLDQITVVDNASTDDSVAYLKGKFGGSLTIIEAKENKGYAYGVNLGIEHVMPEGKRWILLMNNDTVVSPDFFKELLCAAKQHPQYAIFGPLILFHSLPKQIWYLGDKLYPGTMITHNPYFLKELPPDVPPVLPVDFLNGCAMMIRRDVFEKVGLWETRFFMYADEVDFRFRTERAGFKMACVTTAKMWHKVSAIMKKSPPKTYYLRTRNQIWVYRKYANGMDQPIMLVFSFGRSLVLSLKEALGKRGLVAVAIWRGWWDGWMKKKGI